MTSHNLLTVDEVRERIAAAVREAGSQKAFAKSAGISAPNLNQVIKGVREPSEALLAALGLVRVVAYGPR